MCVCVCVCVCSLRYPARNANALLCNLWHAPLYNIFTYCLLNGKNFDKTLLDIKVCVEFLYKFVWNIFHSQKNWTRYDQICILDFYIWVSVHHKSIIYNKPTRCNSGSIVFINNYKYALHVSDALCVHHQEHYKL